MSTSSTICALHPSACESHELEVLNAGHLRCSFNERLLHSCSLSTTLSASASVPLSLPADQSPSATQT
jgi:hypothetical protein